MFIRDGKQFNIDIPHVIGATQYPAGWFRDADNRLAAGVTEIEEEPQPDTEIYITTQNDDGTWNKQLRPHDEVMRAAIMQIDGDVDHIYQIALGGRGPEYTLAEIQATEFRDAGYEGEAPSSVASWAEAKNWTTVEAADDIIATAAGWRQIQAQIRATRLATKERIRVASVPNIKILMAEWTVFSEQLKAYFTASNT